MTFLKECGVCGCAHPAKFRGDCRDDANRYPLDTGDSVIAWGATGDFGLAAPGVVHLPASFYRRSAQNALRDLRDDSRRGDTRRGRGARLWRAYCLALVKAIEAGEIRFEEGGLSRGAL